MAATRVFSTEDGNLNTVSINTSRTRQYSDIDLSFSTRPNGDVYKKTDAAAVKQAVKNLLMTNNYEKPFQPNFGGNLTGLLFELAVSPIADIELQENIISQIETYEPRARVEDVVVDMQPDSNEVNVQVKFTVISTNENVVIETTISRLR